jgi:tetratricopeptide (TPR) repeat protein
MEQNDGYFDLGTYQRPVTTSSPEAQKWFDRGLVWMYGFNHEEAVTCFERAIAADESCALAHWGVAYSLGPNYNKPWELFDPRELRDNMRRARCAALRAKEHAAANATAVERELVLALLSRFPTLDAQDTDARSDWNYRYAGQMQKVYFQFQSDLDVAVLYADALMNLNPWNLWNIKTGEPNTTAQTTKIQTVLETAFQSAHANEHPGLLHLYIHLMEMSSQPEMALPMAERLRNLVPDAGHLQHMPSHIDVLCGNWQKAIDSNTSAIVADNKYFAYVEGAKFYTLYRSHDLHFKIYAAMFAGNKAAAISTAGQLERSIPEKILRIQSPPMADWLEGFLSAKIHVLVRFGLWQDIIALELPEDQELYCVTTAMIHYSKGVSYANTGNIEMALNSKQHFQAAVELVPASRALFNNKCQDILVIAELMLDAEVSFRIGDIQRSFGCFEKAILLSDGLPYDEPWGWMQPPRHAYGALLLEFADTVLARADSGCDEKAVELAKAAAELYECDLGYNQKLPRAQRHPDNVWALHGYAECLDRTGQSDSSTAHLVRTMLEAASKVADVPIYASCACRGATRA